MNAVEIEEAVSALAADPFDATLFPFAFLEAFGNKATTLKRLQTAGKGSTNQSDLPGGVLQRNNIHLATCAAGEVPATLTALRESPATARHKAKFILATDGIDFQAENLADGETVACDYGKFSDHFGFFLPLAGITTVREIRENAFDIKATSRLNKLYIELLKDNAEWGTAARRHDLNHFMARLIFCFFAEDTDIFNGVGLFTATVDQMSARDSSNTHEVISEIFRAMNTKLGEREKAGIKNWANVFPYVNGGLFSGSTDVPVFSKIARSYLMHVGSLDWTKINPDIFGSMIQAVADDEERGALGMHYTSVPNILKVLNPLFLDDLREKLAEAGDGQTAGSARKLLNLRHRIARIRVFDPACGSGNFLVIAYKEMRAIEAEINARRKEHHLRSAIPLTNFRGIELRDFSAEIARLALIIAEYQCDVLYLGQKEALAEFLPLDTKNWITAGNALRIDWLSVCPPTGKGVKLRGDDLFSTPLDQSEIDFENEAGETYICGNPPYLGSRAQSKEQKEELASAISRYTRDAGVLDYVAGWFVKAAEYGSFTPSKTAFVATNSICQGQQVSALWPAILETGHEIDFAYTSFKWANLASHNAGVTVVIVGLSKAAGKARKLFIDADSAGALTSETDNINSYLVPARNVIVASRGSQISKLQNLDRGSAPTDNGALFFDQIEFERAIETNPELTKVFQKAVGGADFIRGNIRWVAKFSEEHLTVESISNFANPLLGRVSRFRAESKKLATQRLSDRPFIFPEDRHFIGRKIFIPQVLSEGRNYITCGLLEETDLVLAPHFQAPATETFIISIISSRLHSVWVETVCGKLKTDIRYSNTLGWNTFPLPPLTETNKAELTKSAEEILLAREEHFPATIADLYDPKKMPENLRAAHDRNDETLERIYIGRRFKNDTERLEKLFELYTRMTANAPERGRMRSSAARLRD